MIQATEKGKWPATASCQWVELLRRSLCNNYYDRAAAAATVVVVARHRHYRESIVDPPRIATIVTRPILLIINNCAWSSRSRERAAA